MKFYQYISIICLTFFFFSCQSQNGKKNPSDLNATQSAIVDTTEENSSIEPKGIVIQKKCLKGKLIKNKGTFDYSFDQLIDMTTQNVIFGAIDPEGRLKTFEHDNGMSMSNGDHFFVEEKIDRYSLVAPYLSILARIYEYTGGSQPYRWHRVVTIDTNTQKALSLNHIFGKLKSEKLIDKAEKKFDSTYSIKNVSPENYFIHTQSGQTIVDFYYFPEKSQFQPKFISIIAD
jgi:hypothetical protein